MNIIPSNEYYNQLVVKLNRAQKRIAMSAMIFLNSGPKTNAIFEALNNAAQRDIKVNLLIDTFSLSIIADSANTKNIGDTKRSLDQLRKSGANIKLVGKIGLNPYAGRYHSKITVIDDEIFCFGGLNIEESADHNSDFMIHSNNKFLATNLYKLVLDGMSEVIRSDLVIDTPSKDKILCDSGTRGQSIIYHKALELSKNARKILFVSQWRPSGRLAEAIAKTDYKCYFNRTSQTPFPDNISQIIDALSSPIKNSYKLDKYIHSKFILFELNNGKKALITGSHNFSYRGVKFGTQEIALLSYNQDLYRQLENFTAKQISHHRT